MTSLARNARGGQTLTSFCTSANETQPPAPVWPKLPPLACLFQGTSPPTMKLKTREQCMNDAELRWQLPPHPKPNSSGTRSTASTAPAAVTRQRMASSVSRDKSRCEPDGVLIENAG